MKNQKIKELQMQKDQKQESDRNTRLKKANALIQKYPERTELFAAHYGEKEWANTYDGVIDFNPEGYKEVVGAEKMSYDDYISAQIDSFGKTRTDFINCYFNIPLEFRGQIEKITKTHVCFKRVFVSGMFPDGDMFDGKEDHVWMDKHDFESFEVNDCVKFFAEVYRYVKTGNGKLIDYSLRTPLGIEKIDFYTLPSDEELLAQEIDRIICENCYLSEQCNRTFCLLPKGTKKNRQNQIADTVKNSKDEN